MNHNLVLSKPRSSTQLKSKTAPQLLVLFFKVEDNYEKLENFQILVSEILYWVAFISTINAT